MRLNTQQKVMHLGCDKNYGCVSLADYVARGKGAPRQGSLEMAGGRNLQARDAETACKIGLPGNKERTDDATRRRDGVGMGIEVNAK